MFNTLFLALDRISSKVLPQGILSCTFSSLSSIQISLIVIEKRKKGKYFLLPFAQLNLYLELNGLDHT